jgi:hypothetical protein
MDLVLCYDFASVAVKFPVMENCPIEASCEQTTNQFHFQTKSFFTIHSTRLVVLIYGFPARMAIYYTSLSSLLIHEYLTVRVSLIPRFQEELFNEKPAMMAFPSSSSLLFSKNPDNHTMAWTKSSLIIFSHYPSEARSMEATTVQGQHVAKFVCKDRCLHDVEQFIKSMAKLAVIYIGIFSLPKHETTFQEESMSTRVFLPMITLPAITKAMQLPVFMECINKAIYLKGNTIQASLGSVQIESFEFHPKFKPSMNNLISITHQQQKLVIEVTTVRVVHVEFYSVEAIDIEPEEGVFHKPAIMEEIKDEFCDLEDIDNMPRVNVVKHGNCLFDRDDYATAEQDFTYIMQDEPYNVQQEFIVTSQSLPHTIQPLTITRALFRQVDTPVTISPSVDFDLNNLGALEVRDPDDRLLIHNVDDTTATEMHNSTATEMHNATATEPRKQNATEPKMQNATEPKRCRKPDAESSMKTLV